MAVCTTITVDWEGCDLMDSNINAMKSFNQAFSMIPITHFICPAYFSRLNNQSDIDAAAAKISSAIKNIDEVALHIHSWYSLMTCAGVQYVTTPLYAEDLCVNGDCGYTVPLGCYTVADITKVLTAGKQLLINAKVKNTNVASAFKSFRCGGWLACDNVLNAVQQAGFTCEASGASSLYYSDFLLPTLPDSRPMTQWVGLLWGGVQQSTPQYLVNSLNVQAYPLPGVTGMYPQNIATRISNPARMVNNKLIQIPDTGSLADYTDGQTLQTYINAAAKQQADTGKDVFISMGFHQESAMQDDPTLHPGVCNIEVIANILNANVGKLSFATVSQAAEIWQALPTPAPHQEEKLVKLERPTMFPHHVPVTGRRRLYS